MRTPNTKQSGHVLIMVALSAVVLIAAVGLAVDSAMGYLVKAKLNSAVDSASLAAARAVVQGDTEDAQRASAQQAAKRFFDINYPDKYLMSTPTLNSVNVAFNKGKVTIDVSAEASLPVSLMGVLGFKTLNVAASAETIRKDLDMVLVMDTSGSLLDDAKAVRAAGTSFLNKFNSTADRVGLLHFASGVKVDLPIKPVNRGFDRGSAVKAINDYDFTGGTNSAEGIWNGRDQLNKITQANRSSLRVIVFFSDGAPTVLSSYFFSATTGNCRDPGSIYTQPVYSSNGDLFNGLYKMDYPASTKLSTAGYCESDDVASLPAWYNAHNLPAQATNAALGEFPIETNSPRKVTKDMTPRKTAWTNVHRAARNVPEAIAAKAREEGIYVFTLGMGASLTTPEGPDNELGQDLLRCMANTVDAPTRCRKPKEPVGLYCYAATQSDLSPCFTRLASAILRISK